MGINGRVYNLNEGREMLNYGGIEDEWENVELVRVVEELEWGIERGNMGRVDYYEMKGEECVYEGYEIVEVE